MDNAKLQKLISQNVSTGSKIRVTGKKMVYMSKGVLNKIKTSFNNAKTKAVAKKEQVKNYFGDYIREEKNIATISQVISSKQKELELHDLITLIKGKEQYETGVYSPYREDLEKRLEKQQKKTTKVSQQGLGSLKIGGLYLNKLRTNFNKKVKNKQDEIKNKFEEMKQEREDNKTLKKKIELERKYEELMREFEDFENETGVNVLEEEKTR